MATGKTNAFYIRVSVDDTGGTPRDISAAVASVTGTGLEFDEQDVTGYSDGVKNFTIGRPSSTIEITGPISNLATTGSHIVLAGLAGFMTTTCTVLITIGIRAAPTTGDPKFSGEYYCTRYTVGPDGTYSARFVPASGVVPVWGTI